MSVLQEVSEREAAIQDEAHNRARPGCRDCKMPKPQGHVRLGAACPSDGKLQPVINDEKRRILAHCAENRRRETLVIFISITDKKFRRQQPSRDISPGPLHVSRFL